MKATLGIIATLALAFAAYERQFARPADIAALQGEHAAAIVALEKEHRAAVEKLTAEKRKTAPVSEGGLTSTRTQNTMRAETTPLPGRAQVETRMEKEAVYQRLTAQLHVHQDAIKAELARIDADERTARESRAATMKRLIAARARFTAEKVKTAEADRRKVLAPMEAEVQRLDRLIDESFDKARKETKDKEVTIWEAYQKARQEVSER